MLGKYFQPKNVGVEVEASLVVRADNGYVMYFVQV